MRVLVRSYLPFPLYRVGVLTAKVTKPIKEGKRTMDLHRPRAMAIAYSSQRYFSPNHFRPDNTDTPWIILGNETYENHPLCGFEENCHIMAKASTVTALCPSVNLFFNERQLYGRTWQPPSDVHKFLMTNYAIQSKIITMQLDHIQQRVGYASKYWMDKSGVKHSGLRTWSGSTPHRVIRFSYRQAIPLSMLHNGDYFLKCPINSFGIPFSMPWRRILDDAVKQRGYSTGLFFSEADLVRTGLLIKPSEMSTFVTVKRAQYDKNDQCYRLEDVVLPASSLTQLAVSGQEGSFESSNRRHINAVTGEEMQMSDSQSFGLWISAFDVVRLGGRTTPTAVCTVPVTTTIDGPIVKLFNCEQLERPSRGFESVCSPRLLGFPFGAPFGPGVDRPDNGSRFFNTSPHISSSPVGVMVS